MVGGTGIEDRAVDMDNFQYCPWVSGFSARIMTEETRDRHEEKEDSFA
jgi:hypothetical protein